MFTRKSFLLMVILALVLGLTACGGTAPTPAAPAQEPESAAPTEAAPAEQEVAEAEEAEEPPSRGATTFIVGDRVGGMIYGKCYAGEIVGVDTLIEIKVDNPPETWPGPVEGGENGGIHITEADICSPEEATSGETIAPPGWIPSKLYTMGQPVGGTILGQCYAGTIVGIQDPEFLSNGEWSLGTIEIKVENPPETWSEPVPGGENGGILITEADICSPEETASAEDTSTQEAEAAPEETTSGGDASTGEQAAGGEDTSTQEQAASGEDTSTEEQATGGGAVPAGCTGPSQADIATILAEHDRIRQEATAVDNRNRAPQMKWSTELACQSEEWSKIVVAGTHQRNPHYKGNPLGHSELSSWTYAPIAESMILGPVTSTQAAVKLWADEKKDYDLKTQACSAGADCGHYGNIIQASMTEIGCGFAKVPEKQPNSFADREAWVCQYKGTYPWEQGKDYAIWLKDGFFTGEPAGWWHVRATKVDEGGIIYQFITVDGKVVNESDSANMRGAPNAWPLEEAKAKGFKIMNY